MISPRKSLSALGKIPEKEGGMNPNATKSCESLYSNSSKGSANMIYRRKIAASNKMGSGGTKQASIIPATNEVRQRVLSARRLRMKTYQNQLADAQQTIAELAHENRILRTLHKRQDTALSKYESTNAELPQLLHSHAEELRVWQTKYRSLQAVNKELEQKLKQKEAVILSLSDQNKYYIQLNKDKNLEERQRLTEKLKILEARLQEKDNDIKMMARKMQLESKQSKQQLQVEQRKSRELIMKLEKTRLELSGYRKLEEIQLEEKININLNQNKGSNADATKGENDIDKYCYAGTVDGEILIDDIDAPNSQRSTHSIHNETKRTIRAAKNVSGKNLTLSTFSTTVAPQFSKQQTHQMAHSKLISLKRFDQGDGNTSSVYDAYKMTNSFGTSIMQKQHSTLSSMAQTQLEKLQNDFEKDVYENDQDGDDHKEAEQSKNKEKDIDYVDSDVNGDFINNIDERNSVFDNNNGNDTDDYYEEIQKIEVPDTDKKTCMKEEISTIRKQISDDYREREAFLDTFCRQATTSVLREETSKKRNSIGIEHTAPNNRKHKLLAALRAIDDNKSQN